MDLYEEQIRLEKEAFEAYKSKELANLHDAISQGRFDETLHGNILMKGTFYPLRDKIKLYLEDTTLRGHTGKSQRYINYLCDGDADVLAYVILKATLRKVAKHNNKVRVSTLASAIIRDLKMILSYNKAVDKSPKLISYLGSEYRRASSKRKTELIEKHLKEFEDEELESRRSEDIRVGAIFIDLLDKSGANLITISKSWVGAHTKHPSYIVGLSNDAIDALKDVKIFNPTFAVYPPMVYPPKKWTSFSSGGFYTLKNDFVKVRFKKYREQMSKECMTTSLNNINKLQKKAWRVNKRVYLILTNMVKDNMIDPRSPKELPRIFGGLPTPSNINLIDIVGEPPNYEEDKDAWHRWNKYREQVKINIDGEVGRRLQYLYTISMAEKMLPYDKFYYAYQLDYRGRVYPLTDFFNPQSKGYVKSMLEFADGEYLTEKGVYWLKIHTANTYGLDKEPFPTRIDWADKNMNTILQIAQDPMGMLSSWVYADSPYEYLASCFAWQDYYEGRKVHLPIQLDAVNSGVQMYSGLLRDYEGAKATCVVGDTREDLYQKVADKVNEKLINGEFPPYIVFFDKEGKERIANTKEEAESLKGKITRSMVKRNVMTLPYSVTKRGMSLQNWDTMDTYSREGKAFWRGDTWVINKLWTELTHDAIYEVVKGARLGQEYLKDVARLLKEEAVWYTPIFKFPVYQPAPKFKTHRIKTIIGTLQLQVPIQDEFNRMKQLNSVSANYIHSIDATILMYVVMKLDGDLGVIHDCFLVHPNKGEEVRDAYKEGYVEVMKSDPLRQFSGQLDPEGEVVIPYVNDLNLDDVFNSEYIIS